MNKFDLIGTIRQYCKNNGICFICGFDAWQNAIADSRTYDKNELILLADLEIEPKFGGSIIQSVQYTGTIALGRKCEDVTTAGLEELFLQKYDRRLLELSEMLPQILKEICCTNDGNIDSIKMSYDLNKFDLNADFVKGDITLVF